MIVCANPSQQFSSYQEELEAAVLRVLRGNRYILGPEVDAFEREFAAYIGTSSAIGVANGTDALELTIRALEVYPGDEVITVSHTAVATVAAIEAAGAVPVLVDVDPDYFTINPTLLEKALSPRTRAVIAVHIYGQAADMDALTDFCTQNKLVLIEDVSQATGATWKDRRLGSIGRVGCFSCYPTKNLGAIGDAGVVTTNDSVLASRIRSLREYGWKERYVSDIPGRNSRLDEVQAAILRVKLRYLDESNGKRRAIASEYSRQLSDMYASLPAERPTAKHVFHLYVIRTEHRDELVAHLNGNGIYPGIHYPVPIHSQPAYRDRIRTSCSMLVTETLAREVLSLPMYPELDMESVKTLVQAMNAFHTSK